MSRVLKPWAEAEHHDFSIHYGDGNCSCHLSPPCGSCTHPGNPRNLEEDEEAWEEEVDAVEREAREDLAAFIDSEAYRHLAEMAATWKVCSA